MIRYPVAVLAILFVGAGIYSLNSKDSSPVVLQYGEVNLKIGETAHFPNLTLTPTSVSEDSRCPKDVQCIWAGTVKVNVEIVSGLGTSTPTIELGKYITTETEKISLVSASPYPSAAASITPPEYIFTFRVARTDDSSSSTPEPF